MRALLTANGTSISFRAPATMLSATRVFASPSGRIWTAAVLHLPPSPTSSALPSGDAPRGVLRFTSADLVLELEDFPPDWLALDDGALIELARRASTPRLGLPLRGSAAGRPTLGAPPLDAPPVSTRPPDAR